MNYHLNQGGQEVGLFPLDELRRRRDAGQLTGEELVWTEGMEQWQPLNAVLQRQPPKFIPAPPPLPGERKGISPAAIAALIIGMFLAGATIVGVIAYRAFRAVRPALERLSDGGTTVRASAMDAARKPAVWTAKSKTWKDVQNEERTFRVRQYVEGYQLRGERNPEYDLLAQQFLTNWIGYNYGGTMDTNLPCGQLRIGVDFFAGFAEAIALTGSSGHDAVADFG